MLTAAAALAAPATAQTAGPEPADRMQWFRQARFGIWFRWGLYAVPQGQWKGATIPGPSERIMRNARIPAKEYAVLAGQFKAEAFDAAAWLSFVETSGGRYVVATAKDFDGFAMYRSAATRYNVYDATPFHRDPLKDLSAECAKRHLPFGVYYSISQDWNEPDAPGNAWDFGPDFRKDTDRYLRAKVEPQLTELLTQYGPIALVQFDSGEALSAAQARRIVELIRRLQPGAAVGGLGLAGDYRSFTEDAPPGETSVAGDLRGEWQQAIALNHTGGYKNFQNDWMTVEEITFRLSDAVSRGGSLLVNAGPTKEGIVPTPETSTMSGMGDWLKNNGEAIFGAGRTAFGAEFGAYDVATLDDRGAPRFIPAKAWRCTTQPGKIFLHLFQWPKALDVANFPGRALAARLPADPKAKLAIAQTGSTLQITLPEYPPVEHEIPDRLDPRVVMRAQLAHVRTVVAIDVQL